MKTVISTKGQVTIPKEVRDRLGLRPGTQLEFAARGGGEAGGMEGRSRERPGGRGLGHHRVRRRCCLPGGDAGAVGMITSVDTSVLLDIFAAQPPPLPQSQAALRLCWRDGSLVVCGVVLAELRPHFADRRQLERALETLGVQYMPLSLEGGPAGRRSLAAAPECRRPTHPRDRGFPHRRTRIHISRSPAHPRPGILPELV